MPENARLHIAMKRPEDVIPHLGKGELHWKKGWSARELAVSWYAAAGFPAPVSNVLDSEPSLRDLKLVDGFFERKTDLRTPGRATQTDLLVIARGLQGPVLIGVEGKVDEPFGDLVGDWQTKNPSKGKERRLAALRSTLGIRALAIGDLRYQLFHRTAAVVYEAQDRGIDRAVMLVHSFDPGSAGLNDFRAFAEAIGATGAAANCVSRPVALEGITTYLAWVSDTPS